MFGSCFVYGLLEIFLCILHMYTGLCVCLSQVHVYHRCMNYQSLLIENIGLLRIFKMYFFGKYKSLLYIYIFSILFYILRGEVMKLYSGKVE